MVRKNALIPGDYMEDKYLVKRVKSYLAVDKEAGRKRALVSFFDVTSGGQHVVAASDIVKIR